MYDGADRGLPLVRLEREMAASPAEFERGLRLGAPEGVESLGNGRYRVRQGETRLEIRITPKGERRIAALCLPLLHVVYQFQAGAQPQRRRLLARLDQAMQRGGG